MIRVTHTLFFWNNFVFSGAGSAEFAAGHEWARLGFLGGEAMGRLYCSLNFHIFGQTGHYFLAQVRPKKSGSNTPFPGGLEIWQKLRPSCPPTIFPGILHLSPAPDPK